MNKRKTSMAITKASTGALRRGSHPKSERSSSVYGFSNHALKLSPMQISSAWKKASKSTRMEFSKQDAETV